MPEDGELKANFAGLMGSLMKNQQFNGEKMASYTAAIADATDPEKLDELYNLTLREAIEVMIKSKSEQNIAYDTEIERLKGLMRV